MKIQPIIGKCSTFGGPDDTGVSVKEGLALLGVGDWMRPYWRALFLNEYNHSLGMARNLNPASFYCAMRWNYRTTAISVLRQSIVRVVSESGNVVWLRPVDYGPNLRTQRIIDLSPGAAAALGVKTDDRVEATLITSLTVLG